tara:strand:+ start:243 stop:1490 length:1248 start_codon:yes stop_codon:yes gene_type:complete
MSPYFKNLTIVLTLLLTACGGGSSTPPPIEVIPTYTPPPSSSGGDTTTYTGDYSEAIEYIMQDGYYTQGIVIYKDGELLREDYRDIGEIERNAIKTKHSHLTDVVIDERWGGNDTYDKTGTWSITKSITSLLIGIASDKSYLRLDETADRFIGEWYGRSQGTIITVEHLVDHRSGLEVMCEGSTSQSVGIPCQTNEDGGTIQAYQSQKDVCINRNMYSSSNPPPFYDEQRYGSYQQQTHIYSNCDSQNLAVVLEVATGMSVADFADYNLFSYLGIQDVSWWTDSIGNSLSYCCVEMTLVDQAKLGQMVLDNDGSVLGEWYIDGINFDESIYSRGFRNYNGWLMMIGFDGQFIAMNKEKNMVIVRGSLYHSYNQGSEPYQMNYTVGSYTIPGSLPQGIGLDPVGVDYINEFLSKID